MNSKQRMIIVILAILPIYTVIAEDFKGQYLQLLNEQKYEELLQYLEGWEKAEPKNPEVYIAYFNCWARTGMKSELAFGPRNVGSKNIFVKENVYKGIEYLNTGLGYAPNRLDMYWGEIETLFEIEDQAAATDALYRALEASKKNKNKWLLANNNPVKDGEAYFLGYIMRFYETLIETKNSEVAERLKKCLEYQIKAYPKDLMAYNILAIYYITNGDADNALKYFLSAEKVNNKDAVVLFNIGRVYAEMGQNDKAREYLNKVIIYGTESEKNAAMSFLDRL